MEHDERHKASGCMEPKARRLYIRDYTLQLDIYSTTPKKKQIFIPIGIICLRCGFILGNLSGRFDLKKKEWDTTFPDYPEPIPEVEDPYVNRQEKRRVARLVKKNEKKLGKLGIKKRRAVITHLD